MPPSTVTLHEVPHGDDEGLGQLLAFADSNGRPRTTDLAAYRELMQGCAAWRCVVSRRGGVVRAATLSSINEVLGLDQVQLNAFLAPGEGDAFRAALEDAGEWGRAHGAPTTTAHVSEPADSELQAWLDAGFEQVGERARVARAVVPDDRTIARVELDGVEVVALADRPELEPAADRLWQAGHRDIPSALAFAEGSVPGFRTELDLSDDEPVPRSLLLAVAGNEVLGLAVVIPSATEPTVAGHRFTTVARSHRGRGIARALKVELIRWAAEHGVERLQASNDEGNAPMRALNDSLGYEHVHRIVLMRRTLD